MIIGEKLGKDSIFFLEMESLGLESLMFKAKWQASRLKELWAYFRYAGKYA